MREKITTEPIETVLDHTQMKIAFESALDRIFNGKTRTLAEKQELLGRFESVFLGSVCERLVGLTLNLTGFESLNDVRTAFGFQGSNRSDGCVVPDGILTEFGHNDSAIHVCGAVEIKSFGKPTALYLQNRLKNSQDLKGLTSKGITIPGTIATAEKVNQYPQLDKYVLVFDPTGSKNWVKESEIIIKEKNPQIKFVHPTIFYLALPLDAAGIIKNSWKSLGIELLSIPFTAKDMRERIINWINNPASARAMNTILSRKFPQSGLSVGILQPNKF